MQTTSKPPIAGGQVVNQYQYVYASKPVYELLKRATETIIALLVLIGLSPLWLAVGVAIKLTSKGPVFFRGRVVGRNGQEFTYYKFRSMQFNSDNTQHRLFIKNYVQQDLAGRSSGAGNGKAPVTSEAADESERERESRSDVQPAAAPPVAVEGSSDVSAPPKPRFKLTNDKRITPVGRIIRKLSIDEVPQLFNVIRGEMAIVGPRPPVPYEYSLYDDWCKQRLAVLPGITGLAQVRMRGTASFRQMVALDLEYIENRSYWLDWQILLKTPLAMLKGA